MLFNKQKNIFLSLCTRGGPPPTMHSVHGPPKSGPGPYGVASLLKTGAAITTVLRRARCTGTLYTPFGRRRDHQVGATAAVGRNTDAFDRGRSSSWVTTLPPPPPPPSVAQPWRPDETAERERFCVRWWNVTRAVPRRRRPSRSIFYNDIIIVPEWTINGKRNVLYATIGWNGPGRETVEAVVNAQKKTKTIITDAVRRDARENKLTGCKILLPKI